MGKIKTISIIGFGRFGHTLLRLFGNDFNITIYSHGKRKNNEKLASNVKFTNNLKQVYESDVIFYCVPIPVFENVIKGHKKYFSGANLLIDVLSVKLHAQSVFNKYLKDTKVQAMLTHPMFGPDSSKNGFVGLPLIIDKFKASSTNYNFWKSYFQRKKLNVIEMSAKEHDKLAAQSQGVAHFIGRVLAEYKLKPTKIDSTGAKKLQEIMDQTCNDTWELFEGLQNYNPYTKSMRIKLGKSYDKIYSKLLPDRINPGKITIGIQGGVGSFNEQAINFYIDKDKIDRSKVIIKYLYTSERVLSELQKGNIDYGQFAMHNSVGGIVQESVYALAKYKVKIVEKFGIKIPHYLMKRKDVDISKLNSIMTHPQVFAQCKKTLIKKYPHLKQIIGKGDLIDNAKAAEAVATGKVPKTTAYLVPKILSKIYDLEIIDENLQDDKENFTSFLIMQRF